MALREIIQIRDQPTEAAKVALRTAAGLKEKHNPLLMIPADLYRSTPVETLHTILLGPYKYLTRKVMTELTSAHKEEVLARMAAFNYSGFRVKVYGNITRYCKSFVGRDFKAWAQMAPFIITPYLTEEEATVWLNLSKVFQISYCNYYSPEKKAEWEAICRTFVSTVHQVYPSFMSKPKIHLVLHLVECMEQFGPTAAFNAERCESFNSFVRNQNIYGNRHAPSRDIAHSFAVMEYIRYICASERCGQDLPKIFNLPSVQHFFNCLPLKKLHGEKDIYTPGTLRKVKGKVAFHRATVLILETGETTVSTLQQSFSLQTAIRILPDELILLYGAVVDCEGDMVHTGDFVEVRTSENVVQYGELLLCFKADRACCCLVRMLEKLELPTGAAILNSYDCPLLCLSHSIEVFPTTSIRRAVSAVHECGSTCTFQNKSISKHIEREQVDTQRLTFVHDYRNLMFCLNIYCMGL